MTSRALVLAAALCLGLGAARAQAQRAGPMPSAEAIARADSYDPPMMDELAAQLARQPDMTGTWIQLQPSKAGVGSVFDPAHAHFSAQPAAGEATFGPIPGTYLEDVPYTPAYRRLYDQHIAEILQGKDRDTFAACTPYGVPRMLGSSPVQFDIIQAPEVMFWSNDYGRTERKIFMDGRGHPAPGETTATGGAGATYSGHSIGRWDGKTLVIDTVDMIPNTFDETGAPHSDKLRMVERIRLIGPNELENRMTFTDPEAFTRAWVVTRYYRRGVNLAAPAPPPPGLGPQRIIHGYIVLNDRPCVRNVRIDEDGFQKIILPQEIEAEAGRR